MEVMSLLLVVSFIETPKVIVADTVGARDSFTASFIASILKGKSVEEAHQLAVNVSGLCMYTKWGNATITRLFYQMIDYEKIHRFINNVVFIGGNWHNFI